MVDDPAGFNQTIGDWLAGAALSPVAGAHGLPAPSGRSG
jgi:hypothetical protein